MNIRNLKVKKLNDIYKSLKEVCLKIYHIQKARRIVANKAPKIAIKLLIYEAFEQSLGFEEQLGDRSYAIFPGPQQPIIYGWKVVATYP